MRHVKRMLIISHVLLAALVAIILFMPDTRKVYPSTALLVAVAIIEGLFLLALWRSKNRIREGLPVGCVDIISFAWMLLIIWEVMSTKLGLAHNVLIPSPENVFHVFVRSGKELAFGVYSSLTLLLSGYILGMFFGAALGIICGWVPRLRVMFYPIANVLAPIPSVIFTPFLVILMPTYRLAAVMVILLGVFWPQFLNMILRVGSLPKAIIDNARVLKVGYITMITKVIFPFIVPDLLKGMRVSLTTGFLMLMYAESFGTKSGIGYFISNANVFANYANILAGIIVCGIVVTILNYGTAWLQEKLTTWH
ncbi:NitT/TauT family transport system permease protein [Desulfitobacterium chlororespirans DSM 11544]|uniref:NitT/TauT family transport system permease protein n=2 Tax=Desulfitobacterium chlororespirans TaxID=51616 RepID=A0A1M7SHM2_9FIRM|nr:NitT/TauT family transport system permease protein [Desulfitobacterium chlororespirans DSM 11544]